jgi:hypothetical protein
MNLMIDEIDGRSSGRFDSIRIISALELDLRGRLSSRHHHAPCSLG